MSATNNFIESLKAELKEELREEFQEAIDRMIQENQDRTFDIKEAAAYIKISEDSLRTMVREKQVPHFRSRSRIFFRRTSLDRWIREQEIQNYEPWKSA